MLYEGLHPSLSGFCSIEDRLLSPTSGILPWGVGSHLQKQMDTGHAHIVGVCVRECRDISCMLIKRAANVVVVAN